MNTGNINNLISNGTEFTNILLTTDQELTQEEKDTVKSNLDILSGSVPTNDDYSVVYKGEYTNLFAKDTFEFSSYVTGTAYNNITSVNYIPFAVCNLYDVWDKPITEFGYIPNGGSKGTMEFGIYNFNDLDGAQASDNFKQNIYDEPLFNITPNDEDYDKFTVFKVDGTDSRVKITTTKNIKDGKVVIFKDQSLALDRISSTPRFRYTTSTTPPEQGFFIYVDVATAKKSNNTIPLLFSSTDGEYLCTDLNKISSDIDFLKRDEYATEETRCETFVNKDGSTEVRLMPISTSNLPADFPSYTVTGRSIYKGNFYVCPDEANDKGYLLILNENGELLFQRKTNSYTTCFRRYVNSKGVNRYCYLESISAEYPTDGNANFYFNTRLVVLDENFNEMDSIICQKGGAFTEEHPTENHDYMYYDDGHYLLAAYYRPEGQALYHNMLQEIKNRKIIWLWDTSDYQDVLIPLSHTNTSTDYAHFNSIIEDYDGNYMISFRNIGLVKVNKATKEIMWVIGRNRNDFTNLLAADMPFQQHHIQVYAKDGSYTIFDNYGDESQSRICRYWLDETTMTATFKEYETTKARSGYMGSAKLINGENEVFDIAYGSGWDFGFEEYNFKTGTQEMQLIFDRPADMYRVWRDMDNFDAPLLTPSHRVDISVDINKTFLAVAIENGTGLIETDYSPESWAIFDSAMELAISIYDDPKASQASVDDATINLNDAIEGLVYINVPDPAYSITNELFDGTRVIDTGIKLFDEPKPFSLVIKYTFDQEYFLAAPTNTYEVILHNMYEVSPWRGITLNLVKSSSSSSQSLDCTVGATISRFTTISPTTNANLPLTSILVFTRDISGKMDVTVYAEDGTVRISTVSKTNPYLADEPYTQQNMYIGAADMNGEFDRYFVGTIDNFNYYNEVLSTQAISSIVNTIKTI